MLDPRPSALRGTAALEPMVLVALLFPWLAQLQDWYVDAGAPGCPSGGSGTQVDPFCLVQDAVDAAADGDTIHVAPGTYFENVVIDKDLELIGAGGQEVTILDGMAAGSVLRVGTADVTLTGLTLTNGSGTPTTIHQYYPGTFGGGLFASDAHVVLTDCAVRNNSVVDAGFEARGGGIFASRGSLTISSSTICGNSASGWYASGGGIYGFSAMTLTSSTVCDNSSRGYSCAGGGVASSRCFGYWYSLALTSSTVSGNTCETTGGGYGNYGEAAGGGIFGGEAPIRLSGSTVSYNIAFGSTRDSGGGITSQDCSLTDSEIRSNSCPGGMGGGIAAHDLVLTGSTISDNDAESGGGISSAGLACASGGADRHLTITDSVIENNFAASVGGGLHGRGNAGLISPSNTTTTLINSVVACNSSSGDGGGIYNSGALTVTSSTLTGNTITQQSARGSAIGVAGSSYPSLTLENSIVWANSGGGTGPIYAPVPHSIEYSLIGGGGWTGAGNIDADPFFADPSSGNFRLQQGSPCIDAGSNAAVPPGVLFDLDGRPRFIEDSLTPDTGRPGRMRPLVDMGAYEGPYFPGRHPRRK